MFTEFATSAHVPTQTCKISEYKHTSEVGLTTCKPLTVCHPESQYVLINETFTSDRICAARTTRCPHGEFIIKNGSIFSDNQCSTCSVCEIDSYVSVPCNGIIDTLCVPCLQSSDCKEHEFLSGDCFNTSTIGPVCVDCDPTCYQCVGPYSTNCTLSSSGFELIEGKCKPDSRCKSTDVLIWKDSFLKSLLL